MASTDRYRCPECGGPMPSSGGTRQHKPGVFKRYRRCVRCPQVDTLVTIQFGDGREMISHRIPRGVPRGTPRKKSETCAKSPRSVNPSQ